MEIAKPSAPRPPRVLLFTDEPLAPTLSRLLAGIDPVLVRPRSADDVLGKLSIYDLAIVAFNYSEGGLNVCKKLVESDDLLPVIVLSQSIQSTDMQAAFHSGAFDYLPPPMEKESLRESVSKAYQRRKDTEEKRKRIDSLTQETNLAKAKAQTLEEGLLFLVESVFRWRYPGLESHTRNVQRLGEALATRLGWAPDRVERLRVASMVHDIGYLSLKESLLRGKPVSDAEKYLWKRHAVDGRILLKKIFTDELILEMVERHHELMDGSGFPDGLRGIRLSPEVKLLSLVDSLSCMVMPPTGEPGMAIEDALIQVMDGSGKLYDQQMVECLVRLVSETDITKL